MGSSFIYDLALYPAIQFLSCWDKTFLSYSAYDSYILLSDLQGNQWFAILSVGHKQSALRWLHLQCNVSATCPRWTWEYEETVPLRQQGTPTPSVPIMETAVIFSCFCKLYICYMLRGKIYLTVLVIKRNGKADKSLKIICPFIYLHMFLSIQGYSWEIVVVLNPGQRETMCCA